MLYEIIPTLSFTTVNSQLRVRVCVCVCFAEMSYHNRIFVFIIRAVHSDSAQFSKHSLGFRLGNDYFTHMGLSPQFNLTGVIKLTAAVSSNNKYGNCRD